MDVGEGVKFEENLEIDVFNLFSLLEVCFLYHCVLMSLPASK